MSQSNPTRSQWYHVGNVVIPAQNAYTYVVVRVGSAKVGFNGTVSDNLALAAPGNVDVYFGFDVLNDGLGRFEPGFRRVRNTQGVPLAQAICTQNSGHLGPITQTIAAPHANEVGVDADVSLWAKWEGNAESTVSAICLRDATFTFDRIDIVRRG